LSGKPFSHPADESPALRIDKLLWFLRFSRNRMIAKRLAEKGHVRLNGRRVDRGHIMVRANDIITLPVGRDVHVIRIIFLPVRRGNALAAQSCYERLQTG
jgi:ribosome-associated heat shock protein Hsp15